MAPRPRNQDGIIGKQEGTPRRVRDRKKRMNINDKMRQWQDVVAGGGAAELRRALGEAIQQIRQQVARQPGPDDKPDLTAAHYLEVCATVDAIRGSVEASERAGRKTMALTVLKDLLGGKADA